MTKYELKTKWTGASVRAFLAAVPDERRRKDAQALCKLMAEVTGDKPKMWGPSIVGFGSYHYTYASGQEGDAPLAGFSPRKAALVLYAIPHVPDYRDLLQRLNAHSAGKSCIYIKRLEDVHQPTLKKLIKLSYAAGDYDANA
ncbi:MAG TPA: DUF1801 domain-containing protein [Patescibacteria group bacterium]